VSGTSAAGRNATLAVGIVVVAPTSDAAHPAGNDTAGTAAIARPVVGTDSWWPVAGVLLLGLAGLVLLVARRRREDDDDRSGAGSPLA
jgi:LPXTG-motif cell wall-anchored protein